MVTKLTNSKCDNSNWDKSQNCDNIKSQIWRLKLWQLKLKLWQNSKAQIVKNINLNCDETWNMTSQLIRKRYKKFFSKNILQFSQCFVMWFSSSDLKIWGIKNFCCFRMDQVVKTKVTKVRVFGGGLQQSPAAQNIPQPSLPSCPKQKCVSQPSSSSLQLHGLQQPALSSPLHPHHSLKTSSLLQGVSQPSSPSRLRLQAVPRPSLFSSFLPQDIPRNCLPSRSHEQGVICPSFLHDQVVGVELNWEGPINNRPSTD